MRVQILCEACYLKNIISLLVIQTNQVLLTLLFCISLFAPFLSNTIAASTLFTAAAQWSADLPVAQTETASACAQLHLLRNQQ